MDFCIRLLTKNDYQKYLPLINEFRKTDFTENQFIETLDVINKSSEIWIIEKDNELIATGTIIYESKFIFNISKVAHIEDICVQSKYRGQGFGKLMVKHLVELSKINKCYKVVLECSEENSHFYEKCGFEKRGLQMSRLS
jgi:glucosamine-phosphate N-acetyltransferase